MNRVGGSKHLFYASLGRENGEVCSFNLLSQPGPGWTRVKSSCLVGEPALNSNLFVYISFVLSVQTLVRWFHI